MKPASCEKSCQLIVKVKVLGGFVNFEEIRVTALRAYVRC